MFIAQWILEITDKFYSFDICDKKLPRNFLPPPPIPQTFLCQWSRRSDQCATLAIFHITVDYYVIEQSWHSRECIGSIPHEWIAHRMAVGTGWGAGWGQLPPPPQYFANPKNLRL